jgi:hypothetical protein
VGQVVASLSEMLDPLLMLEREQQVVASASAAFDRDVLEARMQKEQASQLSLQAEVDYLRRLYAQSHQQLANMSNQLELLSQEVQASRGIASAGPPANSLAPAQSSRRHEHQALRPHVRHD